MGFNVGPLERAEYPDVKFWYLADWTQFCSNRKRDATNKPQLTAMQYMEDQHGHAVSGESVDLMRSLAQDIWVELGISGAASTTWSQVDVESKKGYYRAMAASFFNLRLCDSDWKAERIAEDNYTLWILRWRAHLQTQGPEASKANQSKRIRTSTLSQVQSKKSKVKTKEALAPAAVSTSTSNHFLRSVLIYHPARGNLVDQASRSVTQGGL